MQNTLRWRSFPIIPTLPWFTLPNFLPHKPINPKPLHLHNLTSFSRTRTQKRSTTSHHSYHLMHILCTYRWDVMIPHLLQSLSFLWRSHPWSSGDREFDNQLGASATFLESKIPQKIQAPDQVCMVAKPTQHPDWHAILDFAQFLTALKLPKKP